ncbi:BTAD domain-containing putative transcriptional regulator [Kribbella sp. NPDC006257]|uniref:ATP-binding protein n=1 Tax=Kribbella sp. NPDC006257 TaxID=3156738 RepID=UPI0033BE88F3
MKQPLARALAVRLGLARGEAVADDILIRDLWGDVELARPTARLRVLASRLRGALGDHGAALSRTAAGFCLNALPVDLIAVEEAMAALDKARRDGNQAGTYAAAQTALAQWSGEPLSDVSEIPFAAVEQQRLESLRLELQLAWIQAGLALGRDDVQAELDRLVELHPLHERLIGLSATALAAAGNTEKALSQLDRLRETLADELGIDPSPETVTLEERLRADPVPAAAKPKISLPQASKSFIGRSEEYAELLTRLAEPGEITLIGGPGAGKTRLARELAATEQERDRLVCWLDLAPLGPGDNLVSALAAAVGEDGSAADPLGQCTEALRGALLVVDNAEHLVEAAALLVSDLDWQTNQISILVTSQRPLRIAGEEDRRLGPLPAEAAAELFCARSDAEPGPAVDAICAAVDRFPLGIELAAGLTRTLSIAQLAARIENRLRLLVRGPRDAGLRHTSLRAALDWSHELLEKPARLALRRLAVFARGFTVEAAEQVLADDDFPAETIAGLLAELSDRCLLTVVNTPEGQRFGLLETVRDYALEQLRAAGEEAVVRQRHVGWCIDLMSEFRSVSGRSPRALTDRTVSLEEANLLSAVEWCLGAGEAPEKVSPILAPAWWYWPGRGLATEVSGWLERSIEALPEDSEEYAAGLSTLASLTRNRGLYAEARGLAERCLTAYRTLGNEDRVTVTLMTLIRISLAQNDIPAVIEYAEEAEERSRANDRVSGYARAAALIYLGIAHRIGGDLTKAADLFSVAIGQYRQNGDLAGASIGLENLSTVVRRRGELERARELAGESLRIAWENDFGSGVCGALEALAHLDAMTGEPASALRVLTITAQHRVRIGSPVQVPDEVADIEATLTAARAALTPDEFKTITAGSQDVPLAPVVTAYLANH